MRNIYITIDTECHDIGNSNSYIWGEVSKQRYYGIKLILELAKEEGIPLNFFVDIAECKRYGVAFIKSITDMIQAYGQSVFIHLHPNYISGDEQRTYMWQYNEAEQEQIFIETLAYYKQLFPDKSCRAFRIGRYGANEIMYQSLESAMGHGIIDLSYCAYSPKMCHLSKREANTVNGIAKYKNTILFPNTRYKAFSIGSFQKYINLDTAESTINEFNRVLMKNKLQHITLTMHSWNFINKYFFIKGKLWGNDCAVKKFRKMVAIAKSRGYEFGSLNTNYDNIMANIGTEDQDIDLTTGISGQILSIINNFLRFQKTAKLNKKYFIIYSLFYIALFGILCVLIKRLLS